MFHLPPWDSFLLVYIVSVGSWLIARDLRLRRACKEKSLEGKVATLQTTVNSLSGEVQRLSSRPPSPTSTAGESGYRSSPPFSCDDPVWTEEPTNPQMVRVEIVDDSGDLEVPITLRSGRLP